MLELLSTLFQISSLASIPIKQASRWSALWSHGICSAAACEIILSALKNFMCSQEEAPPFSFRGEKKFSKPASTGSIFGKSKAGERAISCLSWNWCGASRAAGIRPRARLLWAKCGKAGREQSLQNKFLFYFFAHVSLMAQFRNQGPFSSDKVTSETRALNRQTDRFSLRGNLKGRSEIAGEVNWTCKNAKWEDGNFPKRKSQRRFE